MNQPFRNSKYPLLEQLEIIDAGAEGKAVARYGQAVVFIPYGAPGDIVDVQVTAKKKSFMEGRIVNFHQRSKLRVEPFCSHFGLCGGCRWQHLAYKDQLFYKHKLVSDNFQRIGKLEIPDIPAVLLSPKETGYRNKLEFTFSSRRWLTSSEMEGPSARNMNGIGFHLPGMFDRILDIKQCFLQGELSDRIRLHTKKYALDNDLNFYDTRNKTGFLRNLILRNNLAGEWMMIMVFNYDDIIIKPMLDHINSAFPEIVSTYYIINEKPNDSLYDLEHIHYSGKPFITEKMEDLEFRIGPGSFFQTNTSQALQLYRLVREFSALTGNETVYDLYTGTGTIANFIARSAGKVVGVESVEPALDDARVNAEVNGITNTVFVAGDMMKVLDAEFIETYGTPDVIITDPPRAGMHERVLQRILKILPAKIVYVSCNPATQARDIAVLKEAYTISRMQPVDMFPHTQHVENVALLLRKEG